MAARKPKFDPKNYPPGPGELPKATTDDLRFIASKKKLTEPEKQLLIDESNRAQRKTGWVRAEERPDRAEREHSAQATSIIAGIEHFAKDGMARQTKRSIGGDTRAEQRKAYAEHNKKRVLADYDAMTCPERERAGKLERRDNYPVRAATIRRYVRSRKETNTS